MNAGESTARSVLDKPLCELKEEDIAQLTREDCRRYLKEKGMRRPSWNKSQAIQQVISLKALLEPQPGDDSDATPVIRPQSTPLPISIPPKEPSADSPATEPSPSPSGKADPIPPSIAVGEAPPRTHLGGAGDEIDPENGRHVTRIEPQLPWAGQMAIFYGGEVNVYDGVTPDKANAIVQLAASRDELDAPTRPVPFRLPLRAAPPPNHPAFPAIPPAAHGGRMPPYVRENGEEWRTPREIDLPDCPTSRKASLQRYLEKRKDRGRLKGKRIRGGLSSGMEMMCLSQRFKKQVPNEQVGRCEMNSSNQPRPPSTPTRCSSIENRSQRPYLYFDLNDDDLQPGCYSGGHLEMIIRTVARQG